MLPSNLMNANVHEMNAYRPSPPLACDGSSCCCAARGAASCPRRGGDVTDPRRHITPRPKLVPTLKTQHFFGPSKDKKGGREGGLPGYYCFCGDARAPLLEKPTLLEELLSQKIGVGPLRSCMKGSRSSPNQRINAQAGEEFDVYLQGSSEPVRRRSCVRFNERVQVRKVIAVRCLSKHPEKLWFQDKEYRKIRGRAMGIAKRMLSQENVTPKQQNELCSRGLERLLDSKNVNLRRFIAWEAVMDEQIAQCEDGDYDAEYISFVYKEKNKEAIMEATKRASEDAAAIQTYMESTRMFCCWSSVKQYTEIPRCA